MPDLVPLARARTAAASGALRSLVGRVPLGAFLLYNDKSWDTRYDWRTEESRRPGSVPDVVLEVAGPELTS